jgi:hypothetical protein
MNLPRQFLADFLGAFVPSHERTDRASGAEFNIVFAVVPATALAIWMVWTGLR